MCQLLVYLHLRRFCAIGNKISFAISFLLPGSARSFPGSAGGRAAFCNRSPPELPQNVPTSWSSVPSAGELDLNRGRKLSKLVLKMFQIPTFQHSHQSSIIIQIRLRIWPRISFEFSGLFRRFSARIPLQIILKMVGL